MRAWFSMFQSTRPRGARPGSLLSVKTQLMVSIHAPTRGATELCLRCVQFGLFQSTRPRGARHRAGVSASAHNCFNPRAHAGRDQAIMNAVLIEGVSIHAPTRGATPNPIQRQNKPRVSIHAPTRGATSGIGGVGQIGFVSIHAPTRGATVNFDSLSYAFLFQSTRPRGARHWAWSC